jgi:hypothetical protein
VRRLVRRIRGAVAGRAGGSTITADVDHRPPAGTEGPARLGCPSVRPIHGPTNRKRFTERLDHPHHNTSSGTAFSLWIRSQIRCISAG